MRVEEEKYLVDGKILSGKEHEQAWKEIKDLRQSQKDFKLLKKEMKSLEKELERKDKLIEKLQKHNISLLPQSEKKSKEIEKCDKGIATVKDMRRVFALIESEDRIGLSDLTRTCAITSKACKECVHFLINRYI